MNQARKTTTLAQHTTRNTMNKLTTERFDAQNCSVNIASGEITVKNETHRVELRYLDNDSVLEAVCNYIEMRCWDRNAEDKQRKLPKAINSLGQRIDAQKAEASA